MVVNFRLFVHVIQESEIPLCHLKVLYWPTLVLILYGCSLTCLTESDVIAVVTSKSYSDVLHFRVSEYIDCYCHGNSS